MPDFRAAKIPLDPIIYANIQNEDFVLPGVMSSLAFYNGEGWRIVGAASGQNITTAGTRVFVNDQGGAGGGNGPDIYMPIYINLNNEPTMNPNFLIKY